MKPVDQWTPEEAKQAADYLAENPDDASVASAVSQYHAHSVRSSLKRPAEFIPPQSPGLGGFLNLLPSYVGGGTEHFQEPSKEQFLHLFGGKPPEGFDIEQGYRDYADALWAQQFDKAKAEGKPVVRHSQMMDAVDTANPVRQMLKPAIKFGGDLQEAAIGDVGALAHTATLGLDEPAVAMLGKGVGALTGEPGKAGEFLDRYRDARNASPLKTDLEVLGAFAPDAIGGRLAGKLLGAANRAGGPISSALKGAGAGGVVGGASRGLENVGENVANEIAGNGETPRDVGEGVGSGALLGAGLGALGGALGGLGRSLRSGPSGADLRNVEAAGGETSVFRGVKLPKEVETNLSEAEASRSNPVDVAAAKVRGPFAEAAATRNDALLKGIVDRKNGYLNSREGKTPILPEPLVDALLEEARNAKYQLGVGKTPGAPAAEPTTRPLPDTGAATGASTPVAKELPNAKAPAAEQGPKLRQVKGNAELGALPGADTRIISEMLNRSITKNVIRTDEASGAAKYGDAAKVLTADQAHHLGIEFEIPPELQNEPHSNISVIINPKPMTAADVDKVQGYIDKLARVDAKNGGKDEAFNRLTKAIRETRDRFAPNHWAPSELTETLDDGKQVKGWSALNALASKQIGEMKTTLENAGVRNAPKTFRGPDIEKQLGDSIRKYKHGEGRFDADIALEDLAGGVPRGLRKLATVTATRVGPRVVEKAALVPNLPGVGSGLNVGPLLTAAHFRADPLARLLRPLVPGATVMGAAGTDVGTEDYRKLLELATRLQQDQSGARQ